LAAAAAENTTHKLTAWRLILTAEFNGRCQGTRHQFLGLDSLVMCVSCALYSSIQWLIMLVFWHMCSYS